MRCAARCRCRCRRRCVCAVVEAAHRRCARVPHTRAYLRLPAYTLYLRVYTPAPPMHHNHHDNDDDAADATATTSRNVYALDFDGVLCDSVGESSVSAYYAAQIAFPAARLHAPEQDAPTTQQQPTSVRADVGARAIPDEVFDTRAPAWLVEEMRALRPVIETGYENVLMVRLLIEERRRRRRQQQQQQQRKEGGDDARALVSQGDDTPDSPPMTVSDIAANWQQRRQPGRQHGAAAAAGLRIALLHRYGVERDGLVRLFGRVRDRWIERAPQTWLDAHRMYPGVVDALNFSSAPVYIISTKQERFVARLLAHAGVRPERVPRERIYGLEAMMAPAGRADGDGGRSKTGVLKEILDAHRAQGGDAASAAATTIIVVHFVEDRVEALETASLSLLGAPVQYYLATWGYVDAGQRARGERNPFIQLLDLHTFVMRLR